MFRLTRRKGALLIVSAPVLFILSGLFLANTVVNPVESLAYQVGEVLCFIVAPALLIAGIIVLVAAPHAKRHTASPCPAVAASGKGEQLIVHSGFMRLRRLIGLTFLLILFGIPVISEGEKAVNLILAFFVALPFPLAIVPYLIISLHLLSSKRPRKIDAVAIVICTLLLLSMANAPPLAIALIPFLWIAVVAVLITRRRSS